MRQEESPRIQVTHCDDTRQPRLAPNLINAFQAQIHPTGFIGLMLKFSASSAEYKQGGPSLWLAQNFPVYWKSIGLSSSSPRTRPDPFILFIFILFFGNQHSAKRRHGGLSIGR